jgi:hypothetical protein
MADEERVSRASFRRLIRPRAWAFLPAPSRVWSVDDWGRICRGHQSLDMDDHWNAFVENDHLFMYRSWTGNAIYDAYFEPVPTGWHITEAWVADDPDLYKRWNDEFDTLLIEALVEGLLGRHSDKWERLSELMP